MRETHRMTDRGDLYNKIGIGLLIGLGLVYFPIKFVALALLIFGALFCLAWLFLIMPDEVAGSYDSHFEPSPWVNSFDEYRTTRDNLEPEPKPEARKPEYKTTGTEPGRDEYGARIFDATAGTIEWDVTRKINQKQQ